MSIEITNTQITASKTIIERTWRATQFTEFQSDDPAKIDLTKYRAVVHRERVTLIEGLDHSVSRKGAPADVGEPAEGTDGTDPEHYENANAGFIEEIDTNMAEVLSYPDDLMVTAAGVTVPAKIVPILLQATYDIVAVRHKAARLEAKIAKAVEEAIEAKAIADAEAAAAALEE